MEVLDPAASVTAPAAAAPAVVVDDPSDQPVASPRTRRLVTHLLQRVFSLNRRNSSSSEDLLAAAVDQAPPSPKKCPYSAVEKNPSCPYVFQMPLHYPRYTKLEYEAMPEWQLDRLLEEYGLPVSGSLQDKRDYAIGAFVWR
ncbi:uncharacterized protein LOC9637360 [Selaginella moellendorffii]|uniref:uncharacterized protein LOC9637360 n=1 Tax=Selaginella moellendorffii TaxID=88036 RepID=UPI000D1CDBAD|nr:uncharacterized protein LOC9637360 [Selaginella moellendorffii]|eukprot:XP_024535441.1 uncharacterized protein LOC9637360 [Selaginella moellendorffii]